MAKKVSLCLLILLSLCACQSGYKRSPVVTPRSMLCEGDIPAKITLYSPEEAKLDFLSKSYMLNRIETAAGDVRYQNKSIGFTKHGVSTVITAPNTAPVYCSDIPQKGL